MKMISLQCPQCKANIGIEDGRKSCFCTYCGAQIFFDDGSRTITHRKIDEAMIKEAEVKEAVRLKELEIEMVKLRSNRLLITVWIIAMTILAAASIFFVANGANGAQQILGLLIGITDFLILLIGVKAMKKR